MAERTILIAIQYIFHLHDSNNNEIYSTYARWVWVHMSTIPIPPPSSSLEMRTKKKDCAGRMCLSYTLYINIRKANALA